MELIHGFIYLDQLNLQNYDIFEFLYNSVYILMFKSSQKPC